MTTTADAVDWRERIIHSREGIRRVVENTKRIAVLGIKPRPEQPAYFVPEYARQAGYEIIPVPVYYPELAQLFGSPVYRTVSEIPGEVDMVNVFRRSEHIPRHVDDIMAKKPKFVWFQAGIVNDSAAQRFAESGIEVVQNRCLMVELRRLGR